MLLQRFVHVVYDPKGTLIDADKESASIVDIIFTTAFLSLIPTLSGYYATIYIGWDIGVGAPFMMPQDQTLLAAIAAFFVLNMAVYAYAYAIYWIAGNFDLKPKFIHCTELAILTSLPLFLLGFAALYPVLYVDVMIGFIAVAAAIYLLYLAVPIFMHIPEDKGYLFSTWIVSSGLVMMVVCLVGFVIFLTVLST